nr:T9SS type A sorting domain-containing protein [Bacteroidota bacterium]
MPPADGPWPCIRISDFHLISVSGQAINDLKDVDFIGAFDSEGYCMGYAALEGQKGNILLTVYGDDEFTATKDGAGEGDRIFFRSFNTVANTEIELEAEYITKFPNFDGQFAINGLSGISILKESVAGINETVSSASVHIYPNPATDQVTIVYPYVGNLVRLTMISTDGKTMKTLTIGSLLTQLDVGDLHPGIYILKMESAENLVIKRVMIR